MAFNFFSGLKKLFKCRTASFSSKKPRGNRSRKARYPEVTPRFLQLIGDLQKENQDEAGPRRFFHTPHSIRNAGMGENSLKKKVQLGV